MAKYKNFIKDAYEGKLGLDMCNEWKRKIEQTFPELTETKLEIGRWYKTLDGELFCFNGKYDSLNDPCGYGFGTSGTYYDACNIRFIESVKPATKEEVEKALIKEAKKRGFNKETKFTHSSYHVDLENEICKVGKGETYFNESENCLLFNGWEIFNEGKWAEIISKKKLTLKEIEKELGYDIEIVSD